MNKKYKIFILSIIGILLIIICFYQSQKMENKPKEADYSMVCIQSGVIEENEENYKYENKIMISFNKESFVEKVIYQNKSEKTEFSGATISFLESILPNYNELEGIEAHVEETNTEIILTTSYDYTKLNLEKVNTELGNILDDNFILKKIDSLPVKFETFKEIELNNYNCQENKH